MNTSAEIRWFIDTFGDRIEAAIADTPLTLELLAGVGYQETGYTWGRIRRVARDETEFLLYCTGDTIDENSRSPRRAFPKNRLSLVRANRGQEMYSIARQSVERIGSVVLDYAPAARDPDKFCRGYGLFQYDLQHFKTDPDYFLNQSWKDFDLCLGKALAELIPAAKTLGFSGAEKVGARDAASIAIAYNRGSYDPRLKLRQGYKVGNRWYGELVYDYIRMARKILSDRAGQGIGGLSGQVGLFVVNARPWLNMRSLPGGEVIGKLLPGTEVSVLSSSTESPQWLLVDLQGDGLADGYVHRDFLEPL
ncbi:SH3 domain-containing protein [Pseudooceanicola sp. CBS1P-1]|uniref:SH3 domain-containing protein n=1 Tax=Pseudooceanicola albus TaxID=2692189 RepID=A0A6L7GAU2_9RHOB|nr:MULTISPECIES: SH3 domain-containing protein [Pseudooceanicola]MBT9387030.1 SH3 domain-containing protein [Pseudooceanicola endophyticus]MXN21171.1 SH3 domain-containing protein [Pseudooceanicola albus]